jgi:hypothetical protein
MNTPAVAAAVPMSADGQAVPEPARQLLAEAGRLRVRNAGRDKLLLRLGAVLMAAGPALAVLGWFQSSQTSSSFNQNDAIVMALIGVSASIVGVALFLRYSLGEFLRFWMARLIAEQQAPHLGAALAPARQVPGADPYAAAPPDRQEMP